MRLLDLGRLFPFGQRRVAALYGEGMDALRAGDLATARSVAGDVRRAARSPHEESHASELEAWCALVDGHPAKAREGLATASSSSSLLRSVLGVVLGSDPGAVDVLAKELEAVGALELVARALVGSRRPEALVAVLERPGMVTRFSDATLQRATAILFYAGAIEPCETLCLAAFRAFHSPIHLYNAACCACRAKDVDRALSHLSAARDAGFCDRAMLADDGDLADVRADRRFRDLFP